MKKALGIFVLVLLLLITACIPQREKQEYDRYSAYFIDTFDTVIQVIGFASSEAEFTGYVEDIHERYEELHKLFDKYNEYEGINNIRTINNNAGIQPVKVNQEIIDLILFSKEWYERTNGKLNIALGGLIDIWDDTMKNALDDPEQAVLPSVDDLKEASLHGNIDDIIVDQDAMTVFLADEKMSLDFGAVAKGFAGDLVGKEMVEKGFTSGAIVSGGNWKILGEPKDPDFGDWKVGITNPNKDVSPEEAVIKIVKLGNKSIDSSGDYERFVMIDGLRVHHIIDQETLFPGAYYRGVTVIADDASVAEYLTTELFLLPYEEGLALIDSLDGVEALWVLADGTVKATDGMIARFVSE